MKVLIADDDPSARLILNRVLSRYLSCDVLEAENGIEALLVIERERPDLVLLDTMMPELDGFGVLEAIRSGGEFADLPVVSVTAASDRAIVLKLINLGIVDYILKPVQLETARKRLGRILTGLSPRKHHVNDTREQEGALPSLLIVDKDPSYVTFARLALDDDFKVLSSNSGAEGLTIVRNGDVQVVLAGDGLPLMNEKLMASAIRRGVGVRPGVYLLTERSDVPVEESRIFDGVIRKAHTEEALRDRVNLTVLARGGVVQALKAMVRSELTDQAVPAMEQAVGVMTLQSITPLQASNDDSSRTAGAVVRLVDRQGAGALVLGLLASIEDVEGLAEAMLEKSVALDDGAAEAFGELLDTVAGRLSVWISQRGISLHGVGRMVGKVDDLDVPPSWDEELSFSCENGATIVLVIAVEEKKPSVAVA